MKRPENVILRGETRLFLSVLLTIILSALAAANIFAAPFAYITNHLGNTVSVIDTATNAVVATIPVGSYSVGVAVNPSGTRVYVVSDSFGKAIGNVMVINTSTNTVVATIPVGGRPQGVAVNPSGTRLYVANYSSNTVSVIDTNTNTVVTNIPVGSGPVGVAVNPSGTRLYVGNRDFSNTVSVIDTNTNTVVTNIPVGAGPQGVAVNLSGTRLYVGNWYGNTASVIDTSTNAVVATIPVGSNPHSVAANPSGTRVYVANYSSNTVSVIDTSTNTIAATISVGSQPAGVAVNPSGTRLYVAIFSSNIVSVIDTATNAVVATIPVGSGPVAFGQFIGPGVPVARWPGEGNANDVIGGHNGTLAGGVTFVPGRVGQAFKFDTSANSYITLPNSPDFMPASNQVTINAWIKPDFAVANHADIIFVKRDGCGSNRSYGLAVSKAGAIPFGYPLGTIVWSASVAGDDVTPITTVPNDGQFHHIAGTYDGIVMRVYMDGVLIGEKPHTGPIPVTSDPPFIGLNAGCSGQLSAAVIDEIEFWNRALSASEMQSGWEVPANSPPVAQCTNVTVDADATCKASASVDNGSFDPDSGDTITVSQSPAGPYELGTTTVTLTVTDNHGASSQCTATVTVEDNTVPTITVPADTTVECGNDTSPAANGTATGADNCNQFSINYSDSSVAGCGNTEVITRTWTVTDFAGNSTSGDQTITVVDTTPPTTTCPADVTLECPADTSVGANGSASGSDTCGSVTISHSDTSVPDCGNTEVITRTWTATDECGNTATCTQTITVQDTTAPVLSGVPADVTIECDSVPAAAEPTVTDDCDAEPDIAYSEVRTDGGCPDNYTLTRTWTATDDCGNSSSQEQVITVQDTTAPVVTATLVPVKLKKKHGCFRVEFSATDNCDDATDLTAVLNGHPVTNGELVRLHKKKKYKVKVDDGSSDDKSNDDDSSADCGTVKFEGPDFTLTVTATDDCGNEGAGTDTHVFEGGSDDDDSHDDNGIHRGNKKEDNHGDKGNHKSEGKEKIEHKDDKKGKK